MAEAVEKLEISAFFGIQATYVFPPPTDAGAGFAFVGFWVAIFAHGSGHFHPWRRS
jgi:hypothetical protein